MPSVARGLGYRRLPEGRFGQPDGVAEASTRALAVLYGLCNGWIADGTTIVEAPTGSTAVSEAYFARFLGLSFVAVMPASTSPEKIVLIEAEGGSCHLVDDATTVYGGAFNAVVIGAIASPNPSRHAGAMSDYSPWSVSVSVRGPPWSRCSQR
jgi:threonine synthase